jgi:hypothetical protein
MRVLSTILKVTIACFLAFWLRIKYRHDFDRFVLRRVDRDDEARDGKVCMHFIYEFCGEADANRFALAVTTTSTVEVKAVPGGFECRVKRTVPAKVLNVKLQRIWLGTQAFWFRGEFVGVNTYSPSLNLEG